MTNNTTNQTTTTNKEWKPNENQAKFLKVLESYPDGATLSDILVDKGIEFKTGSINSLVSKGMVATTETERVSDIVYRGVAIGVKTDKVKKYRLA